MKKKISRQLFLIILISAIIPSAIISFVFYHLAKKELQNTSFMHLRTVALDYAGHINIWLRERCKDAETIAKLPSIEYLCRNHLGKNGQFYLSQKHHDLLNKILNLLKEQFPCFTTVHIVDPSGNIIASTDRRNGKISFTTTDLRTYKNDQSKKVLIGSIRFFKGRGWYLRIVTPIKSSSNSKIQVLGYVIGMIEATHTLNRFKKDIVGLGKTGEIYVVDIVGTPITTLKYIKPDDNNLHPMKKLAQTQPVVNLMNHRNGTSFYKNYAGKYVAGSYLWLPDLEIGIVAEMDAAEIMMPLHRVKVSALLIIGILLTLSILATIYISEHVSSPIVAIAKAARRIAAGNLDERLSIRSGNEVGQLADAFNSMTEQLASTIKELEKRESSLRRAYQELKEAQAQLVQSEKMAAIGELVASVVHEMRNPLSSIKLNLQIIGRNLDKDSRIFEHYRIALDQVSHLDKMFSELLNYSKPIVLEKIPILPGDLVELAVERVGEVLATHGIEIKKRLDDFLPPIEVDVDKIIQVLINIFNNAIEAIDEQGVIEIETRASETGYQNAVEIVISDNGAGIPEHQLDHIFKTFFTTKKKGTGLGLTVVKKIMEAHQGTIRVTSKVGEGTKVTLVFPVKVSSKAKNRTSE